MNLSTSFHISKTVFCTVKNSSSALLDKIQSDKGSISIMQSLVQQTSCICRSSRDLSEGKKRRSRTKKFSPKSSYISRRKKNADKKTLPNPICLSLHSQEKQSQRQELSTSSEMTLESCWGKITQIRMQIALFYTSFSYFCIPICPFFYWLCFAFLKNREKHLVKFLCTR